MICALDVGTTGTRALLLDRLGACAATSYREVALTYPQPGWVEQDPAELWQSTQAVLAEVCRTAGAPPVAIGITNQRETTIVWDRQTGEPVYPAIVWQDRRTERLCAGLRDRGAETFKSRCGLVVDPYFSATKLMWLLENVPGLRARAERGELAFGTVDSWILWNLTAGAAHLTDASNASRTLLFDIHERRWSGELLERCGVPRALLPSVQDTCSDFGATAAGLDGVPSGVPIFAVCGDQQSSLFGQLLTEPGDWKATYGTGAFLMAIIGPEARITPEALTSIAWVIGGRPTYHVEAAVFVCGAALQWLRDGLRLFDDYAEMHAMLAGGAGWRRELYCVPAFTGFGTPFWNAGARGLLIGIERGTSAADVCVATVEGIALEIEAAYSAMSRTAGCRRFVADGGATRSTALMQFQSDVLQRPVTVSDRQEGTAYGAAFLAGLQAGFWSGIDELQRLAPRLTEFSPQLPAADASRVIARWGEAARRALDWAG
jgi:glycerol kinase